jgi:serine/threonine protein kinase
VCGRGLLKRLKHERSNFSLPSEWNKFYYAMATSRGPNKYRRDQFHIIEEIFRSNSGAVYKARLRKTGETVVLKERNAPELGRGKGVVEHEVELLEKVNHTNVIRCFGHFREPGTMGSNTGALYMVLEYASGGDLYKQILKRREQSKHYREETILDMFKQMCLGLCALHEMGIIHRDIKALNILLGKPAEEGGVPVVKIGDLGVGRELSIETVMVNTFYGTPLYASPELCENKPYNELTDIWSLGVVLYEMAALEHPFTGRNLMALASAISKAEYKPIPKQYSSFLVDLIAALLNKNQKKRPRIKEILGWLGNRKYSRERSDDGHRDHRQEDRGNHRRIESKYNAHSHSGEKGGRGDRPMNSDARASSTIRKGKSRAGSIADECPPTSLDSRRDGRNRPTSASSTKSKSRAGSVAGDRPPVSVDSRRDGHGRPPSAIEKIVKRAEDVQKSRSIRIRDTKDIEKVRRREPTDTPGDDDTEEELDTSDWQRLHIQNRQDAKEMAQRRRDGDARGSFEKRDSFGREDQAKHREFDKQDQYRRHDDADVESDASDSVADSMDDRRSVVSSTPSYRARIRDWERRQAEQESRNNSRSSLESSVRSSGSSSRMKPNRAFHGHKSLSAKLLEKRERSARRYESREQGGYRVAVRRERRDDEEPWDEVVHKNSIASTSGEKKVLSSSLTKKASGKDKMDSSQVVRDEHGKHHRHEQDIWQEKEREQDIEEIEYKQKMLNNEDFRVREKKPASSPRMGDNLPSRFRKERTRHDRVVSDEDEWRDQSSSKTIPSSRKSKKTPTREQDEETLSRGRVLENKEFTVSPSRRSRQERTGRPKSLWGDDPAPLYQDREQLGAAREESGPHKSLKRKEEKERGAGGTRAERGHREDKSERFGGKEKSSRAKSSTSRRETKSRPSSRMSTVSGSPRRQALYFENEIRRQKTHLRRLVAAADWITSDAIGDRRERDDIEAQIEDVQYYIDELEDQLEDLNLEQEGSVEGESGRRDQKLRYDDQERNRENESRGRPSSRHSFQNYMTGQ